MSESKYFDLHITGLGYLNRVREVSPKKGAPFYACDIVALHGSAESPDKTRFDCRVSGAEAERLIKAAKSYVDQDQKVLIGFKLGDLYPDLFEYQKGEKVGQTGVSLKARLLRVTWVKVDGETVYTASADSTQEPQSSTA